jgi:hypothetical protein
MGLDIRLDGQDRLLGSRPTLSQIVTHFLALVDDGRSLYSWSACQNGDEIVTLVFFLEAHPVLEHPQVMPQVQVSCRPDAGYDALLVHISPSLQ